MENDKSSFSLIGALLAVISSAVGLGNLWKFPSEIGKNGGAAFILIYLLSCIFLGIPILLGEFFVGHKTKKLPVDAINSLTENKIFRLFPVLGFIATVLTVAFYSDVVGWVLRYFIYSLFGKINITNTAEATAFFNNTTLNPYIVSFFQIAILLIVTAILISGAVKGIEKITKIALPLLLVILIILVCYSMTLPGVGKALSFIFKPDFSKITGSTILSALGLAFFKMSIGYTGMMIYFSYFPNNMNPVKSVFQMLVADMVISILCGLVIFSIAFTFNIQTDAGAGLLFIAMPVAFSKIKIGCILLPVFFLLALLASSGSMIALTETCNSFFEKAFKIERKKAVIYNTIFLLVVGTLASLSTTNVLGSVKIFGMNFFDFFDFMTAKVVAPLASFIFVIFLGFSYNKEIIFNYFTKNCGVSEKIVNIWYFIFKYISSSILVLTALINFF